MARYGPLWTRMDADLNQLEQWAGALLDKLEPSARRALTRSIAIDLRRSQRQRIAAQRNPDGSAYAPRKQRNLRGKDGRIRRQAMFRKLRTFQHLKPRTDADSLAVGFFGRAARIARVHQHGQRDRVAPGGPEVQYPARGLLGFTLHDRELIRQRLLDHLTP